MSTSLSPEDTVVRDRIISAFTDLMKEVANEEPMKASSDKPPEVIYHYTTAEGLVGILENAELWVSRAVCLNDLKEIVYGEQLVRAILSERAERFKPDNPTLPAYFNAVAAEFKGISDDVDDKDDDVREVRLDPFVASFSAEPDLLGQWAYYASKGGYCIGFRRSEIAGIKDISGESFELRQIVYDEDDQRKWLESAIDRFEKLLLHEVGSLGAFHQIRGPGVAARTLWVTLRVLLSQMKAPGFKPENEWRLISLIPDVSGREDQGVKNAKRMGFRRIGSRIVPYLKAKFEPETAPIESIMSGPTVDPKIARDSILRLLRSKGYPSKIGVRASGITLRE
jgi:hypothetical protein